MVTVRSARSAADQHGRGSWHVQTIVIAGDGGTAAVIEWGVSFSDHADDDVRNFFASFADAHAREDVTTYLQFLAPDTVWVTSRGVCYRGRDALGAYRVGSSRAASARAPCGTRSNRSTPWFQGHGWSSSSRPTWTARGARDEHASHTHLYLVVDHEEGLRIAAGQNTVRA